MLGLIGAFFSSGEFLPHGLCLLWRPELIWLHILSDTGIALAYFSIPAALFVLSRRRPDLIDRRIVRLFVAFIALCGLTHLFGVATLFEPVYALEGAVKAWTGIVSILTAIILWLNLPAILALPSRDQLAAANQQLAREVAERQRTEAAVRELNAELERRVAERTGDLERSNRELAAALADRETLFREVHHRVKNNLQMIGSLLTLQAQSAPPGLAAQFEDLQHRIAAMGLVHTQLYQSEHVAEIDLGAYLGALRDRLADAAARRGVRWRLEVEPVRLTLDEATTVGLIVTEAVTNALKHAFPRGEGEVAIKVSRDGEQVAVAVADDGVGLLAPGTKATSSVGQRLMDALARQLGGEMSYAGRPGGGALLTLRFPAAG